MVEVKPEHSQSTPEARGTLALPQATALIVGSIIGVGIFNLPYSLAAYRADQPGRDGARPPSARWPSRCMFAALSRRLPADGGPYAYARVGVRQRRRLHERVVLLDHRLGGQRRHRDRLGVLRRGLRQQGQRAPAGRSSIALVGLWIPAAVNLTGVKNMGAVQLWTTIIKFIPLALMSTRRAVLHQHRQLPPVERQRRQSTCRRDRQRDGHLPVQLPRVETAAVAAAKVRDPERNVPRATIFGTLGSAVVYLLSLIAVFGIVPSQRAGQGRQQRVRSRPRRTPSFGGTWAGYLDGRAPSSSRASAPSTAGR